MARGVFIRKADRTLLATYKHCAYCGCYDDKTHIEHIFPVYLGGSSKLSNLTKACARCNAMKSTFTIVQFAERIVKKRDLVFNKAFLYTFRIRRFKRPNYKGEFWHEYTYNSEKLRECRKAHTYYTKILQSIYGGTYRIFPEEILW